MAKKSLNQKQSSLTKNQIDLIRDRFGKNFFGEGLPREDFDKEIQNARSAFEQRLKLSKENIDKYRTNLDKTESRKKARTIFKRNEDRKLGITEDSNVNNLLPNIQDLIYRI